jgi:hypothetical protein
MLTELEIAEINRDNAEKARDEACRIFTEVQRAFDKSRSKKNRYALIAASQNFEIAAEAARYAQDRVERARTVANRLAILEPRRKMFELRGNLSN